MEWAELLRDHTKKMPCFSCIVRVTCSYFHENGQLIVRTPDCKDWQDWIKGRDKIVLETADRVISLAISEVRELERRVG
jgi:hypothetical protein